MEVTKANLATYLAGLTPSATPYQIEIKETVASDWRYSHTTGTVGNIINTNTPNGVYLDLGLTIIPNSVTDMGYTFNNCTSLTTAPIIPSSVTNMVATFEGCTSLTIAPIIPTSVNNMSSTFSGCTSLTTAPIIPSSVNNMNSTFNNCTSLTTAPIIPTSVINMSSTFYNCTALTTAPIIPTSVNYMSSTFYGCTSLTTVPIIPSNVTNMYYTFGSCTALTIAPIIPSSVTSMRYTFSGCISLHTIQNFAVNVDNCNMENTFQNCPALANIYVTTLTESTWHLLHTDTDATGTDYTIYNPDGTVAGSGTVAGTSQVLTLYGKSDELVISANITPTLAEETATSQVQWHKSGLPYDDELMIFNAKNPTTVISNILITTLRYSASFSLPTYLDGQKIRIANTHATNTITCTLPSGQTMNGQSSFTIAPDTLLEFELIGTAWKCVSNVPELIWSNQSPSTDLGAVTLNLSGAIEQFRFCSCVYRYYSPSNYTISTGLLKINEFNYLSASDNGLQNRKITSISGTSVVIGEGYLYQSYNATGIINNTRCVPVSIYGMK